MAQDQIIGSYVHIPGKPREQHALFMLRRIASLVKPIMSKGGYKVGRLVEFYPAQKSLLGISTVSYTLLQRREEKRRGLINYIVCVGWKRLER